MRDLPACKSLTSKPPTRVSPSARSQRPAIPLRCRNPAPAAGGGPRGYRWILQLGNACLNSVMPASVTWASGAGSDPRRKLRSRRYLCRLVVAASWRRM